MVLHNPPKHDPDLPSHEHYATEGKTKYYRPKKTEESLKKLGSSGRQEHEMDYWQGDHS